MKEHDTLTGLPPDEDFVVCWQYNLPVGSFRQRLAATLEIADTDNLDRLALAFPEFVAGLRRYRNQDGWWTEVRDRFARAWPQYANVA